MSGTVVCDVTDSLAGPSAAEFAGALGRRLGLRLVLVYVIGGIPLPARESMTGKQAQSGAEQTLEALAREVAHGADTRVAVGNHSEALARIAAEEGADLIIVGARPAGVGGRNLRWTLAREVEAATSVPVLVAPPATRKRSDRRLAVVAEADTR